jgi:hypothetical protein
MTRPRFNAILILVGLTCASSIGCVQGRVYDFVRYDSGSDSFVCLQVYLDLRASEKKDLDHGMVQTWVTLDPANTGAIRRGNSLGMLTLRPK